MSFYSWPYPPPPDDPVASVDVEGAHFRINGRRQHIRAFTDFGGFIHYLHHGGALSPHALQHQIIHRDFVSYSQKTGDPLGLPGVPALSPRILLMRSWGDLLEPRLVPDFFTQLDAHAAAMNTQRFIPLYVLLACTHVFGMDLAWQRAFVARACEVLRKHVCLVELVNEYNAGDQQVDPLAFDQPPGVIISRGSPGEAGPIIWPPWDWTAIRSRRDSKWLQTISDSAYAFRHGDWSDDHKGVIVAQPVWDTEPKGHGPAGTEPKRNTDTWLAFKLGQQSAAENGAAAFHSESGNFSTTMSPEELNCAICFWRGMASVPEEQMHD